MSAPEDDDEKRAVVPAPNGDDAKAEGEALNTRRQFLKLSLALGLVLVVAGVASVTLSLVNPTAPAPAPPPPATETATETSTETVISTETVTEGSSGASTGTASTSSSSTTSQSTTSTSTSTTLSTSSLFPQVLVANISDVTGANLGQTVSFNYPLEETPNILVKLGVAADGGVGPDGDIVAYSQVCQHLGCIWGFVAKGASPVCASSVKAAGPIGYCCCHGSVYDLTNGAKVIGGPAPRPVPQVTLSFDESTGNIYATGMGPPTIYGYHTGSDDVAYDLQGGTPVS